MSVVTVWDLMPDKRSSHSYKDNSLEYGDIYNFVNSQHIYHPGEENTHPVK
jgi:hypothetical protein